MANYSTPCVTVILKGIVFLPLAIHYLPYILNSYTNSKFYIFYNECHSSRGHTIELLVTSITIGDKRVAPYIQATLSGKVIV